MMIVSFRPAPVVGKLSAASLVFLVCSPPFICYFALGPNVAAGHDHVASM